MANNHIILKMVKINLKESVSQLRNIGPSYIKKIEKLGICKLQDFLFYFPFRYEDFSNFRKINELQVGEEATIKAAVVKIDNRRSFKRRMNLTQAVLQDDTGKISAVWFNQPYLKDALEDKIVNISGKLSMSGGSVCFSNPVYEVVFDNDEISSSSIHTGRLVPIYPETRGVSSRWIRHKVKLILPFVSQIEEFIPQDVLKKYHLPGIQTAIKNVHFPKNIREAMAAKKRFAFADMLVLQIHILRQRMLLSKERSLSIPFDENLAKNFVSSLPFSLTPSQKKSMWDIFQDLRKPTPMNRLLEGDVGSGKTVVATAAALMAMNNNSQAVFMAPTEILALQHFNSISSLLKKFKIVMGVITSGKSVIFDPDLGAYEVKKERIIEMTASGEIKFLIGTHSLIQDFLEFKNLALVIIDEQHRFGIDQRTKLLRKADTKNKKDQDYLSKLEKRKGYLPHLLSMTATPIPRTMALGIYGDLDMSLLRHMPKGRRKIITQIVSPAGRERVYEFIRSEMEKGHQVFVICPLIEDSDKLQAKAAVEEYEKLEKLFSDFNVKLIHGKMKSSQKESIMLDFNSGHVNMLIATSVVEVGIDVPNATCMIIEGAERFGLAQLHQLRGRIGRGESQSYCFLFAESSSKKTRDRLNALLTAKDGYELAQYDLDIRGPGEFLGIKQSGIPDLAMKSLNNLKLIESARSEALSVLAKDPDLKEHALLMEEINKFSREVHLE